ncbi:MAG: GtrA family protein [Ruthenibacterium sp.]
MKKLFALLGVHSKEEFWKLFWQFFKFGLVGLSNTFISTAVYYIFVWISPDLYLWGGFVGWIVSVLNAFYWSNRFVFKNEDNTPVALAKRLFKSYLTYGSTFLLSQLLLFLEVNFWGISVWLAPIINLVITIPLNFVLNKFFTYQK